MHKMEANGAVHIEVHLYLNLTLHDQYLLNSHSVSFIPGKCASTIYKKQKNGLARTRVADGWRENA